MRQTGRNLFALMVLAAGAAEGAGLSADATRAWDGYLQAAQEKMDARLRPGSCFLWAEESDGRMQELREGEIVVAPGSDQNPKRIPGGLIHHWIGAVFVPGVSLDELLATVRDYSRYGKFYPSVVSAKLVSRSGPVDRLTTIEKHKAMFSNIALDADFTATYKDAGHGRAYNISHGTRLQEIENYGDGKQRELPPDASKAYLWRLDTITRYEQRDGGVYMEIEAFALSRDIPASLRWLVDKFVRQAAQGAMATTLRQTRDAVMKDSSVAREKSFAPVKPPQQAAESKSARASGLSIR